MSFQKPVKELISQGDGAFRLEASLSTYSCTHLAKNYFYVIRLTIFLVVVQILILLCYFLGRRFFCTDRCKSEDQEE